MHLCVCLITLISPLIICNLSNLTLYRLLALLQGSFNETRDKQCACCIRGEHKPVICTCFIEVILGIRILWSWILSVSKGGIPMFTYLCVSRHFRHYT